MSNLVRTSITLDKDLWYELVAHKEQTGTNHSATIRLALRNFFGTMMPEESAVVEAHRRYAGVILEHVRRGLNDALIAALDEAEQGR